MPTVNTYMQGKICMITGANSGIGKATALGLAQMGATVVLVSRDRARGEEAQNEIKAKSGNDAIDLLLADLSSQQSIRQLVADFKQRYTRLHVLINYELARRLEGTGVTANCLHPGFVATNIAQRDLALPARLATKLIFRFGTSPEIGAKTSLYLATSPDVEGVTGKYFEKSVPRRSAALSYDVSLQQQLWKACAQLTGLTNEALQI